MFVISDHHLDGMQAFLSAYHGEEQSSESQSYLLRGWRSKGN